MAHFIDPRERKFHGTWINEGRREGGREGYHKIYQYGSFFSLGHEPNQPFQPSQTLTLLGFLNVWKI
jgi:hypothetical protein